MKKIIALVSAVAVSAAFSAFALDISAGVRGTLDFGLGTNLAGYMKDSLDALESEINDSSAGMMSASQKVTGNVGGGFGVWAHLGLVNAGLLAVGVQPEVNIYFNNGGKDEFTISPSGTFKAMAAAAGMSVSDLTLTMKGSYNSLDIPVLVTASFSPFDALNVGIGVGPYVSIPLGKLKVSTEVSGGGALLEQMGEIGDEDEEYDIDGVKFGLALGANMGYKVGPGSIVLDVRYLIDFGAVKIEQDGETSEVLKRKGLAISAGYQMRF